MNILKAGPIDLSEHMVSTYQTLRVVLVVIAAAFPLLLWIGGKIFHEIALQASMSNYYHAGGGVLRNWFVGLLFAISGLLIVYKGFRPAENVALNFAGIFAVLVALVPNSWDGPDEGLPFHGIFAVSFFLCIAYVCIFCASATLSLILNEDRRTRLRRIYKSIGWAMVVAPLAAAVLSYTLRRSYYIFFAEFCGVYAFAAYWFVKTLEIRRTNADQKAASGELELAAGKGASDAVRELPVVQKEPAFAVPKLGEQARV